jgi:hypothetical protein
MQSSKKSTRRENLTGVSSNLIDIFDKIEEKIKTINNDGGFSNLKLNDSIEQDFTTK